MASEDTALLTMPSHLSQSRNRTPLLIAGSLSGITVILIVALAVIGAPKNRATHLLTLEDALDPALSPQGLGFVAWRSATVYVYRSSNGSFVQAEPGKPDAVVIPNPLVVGGVSHQVAHVFFSTSGDSVLIAVDAAVRYRHSFVATYVHARLSGVLLSHEQYVVSNTTRLVNAQISPGDAGVVAVVEEKPQNGGFVLGVWNATARTALKVVAQTTSTRRSIGVAAWVYEEEILSDYNTLYWNKEGTAFAYYDFDGSDTPVFQVPFYSPDVFDNPYPTYWEIPYPYVGESIPTVTVRVYSLASATLEKSWEIPADSYLYSAVRWRTESSFWSVHANRRQNETALLEFDLSSNTTTTLFTLTDPDWIEPTQFNLASEATVLTGLSGDPDKEYFALLRPNTDYMHAALYARGTQGGFVRWLTHGSFNVLSIDGWSPSGKFLTITTTMEGSLTATPWTMSLADISKPTPAPTSLLSSSEAEKNGSFSIQVFPGTGNSALLTYLGNGDWLEVPTTTLLSDLSSSSSSSSSPSSRTVLIDNADVRARWDNLDGKDAEYEQFALDTNVTVNVRILKPYDFSDANTYPVLFYFYGGPGSQTASRKFVGNSAPFISYAASHGMVVVTADGRGTGGKERSFMTSVKNSLGVHEVEDQLAVARYMKKEYSWVDLKKFVLFGWSFGGFLSSRTFLNAENTPTEPLFRYSIAIAPVTSWLLYDATYTERYMGLKGENGVGYETTSVIKEAVDNAELHDMDHFLLVHGTRDDNVHTQNSYLLSNAVAQQAQPFHQMYFTNSQHSMMYQRDFVALYAVLCHRLEDWIGLECKHTKVVERVKTTKKGSGSDARELRRNPVPGLTFAKGLSI